jgi:adenylate cyclase
MLGSCFCGQIEFEISEVYDAGFCHCTHCHITTGSAFLTFAVIKKPDFSMKKGQPSQHVRNKGTQFFCGDCGTPTHFEPVNADYISVGIGCLEHPEEIKPRFHQFYSRRIPWVNIEDDLTKRPESRLAPTLT